MADKTRLVSRRNISSEEVAVVCDGRLFHARAAATGNARSPRVDRRVDGTSIVDRAQTATSSKLWCRPQTGRECSPTCDVVLYCSSERCSPELRRTSVVPASRWSSSGRTYSTTLCLSLRPSGTSLSRPPTNPESTLRPPSRASSVSEWYHFTYYYLLFYIY